MSKNPVRAWLGAVVAIVPLLLSPSALAQWRVITSTELEALLATSGLDEAARGRVVEAHMETVKSFGTSAGAAIREFMAARLGSGQSDRAAVREWQVRARAAAQAVEDSMRPVVAAIQAEGGGAPAQMALNRLSIARDLMSTRAIGSSMSMVADPCTQTPSQWLSAAQVNPKGVVGLDALDVAILAERARLARELRDGLIDAPMRELEVPAVLPTHGAATDAPPPDGEVVSTLSAEEGSARSERGRVVHERWLKARQAWWDADGRALGAILPQLAGQGQFLLLIQWCTATHGRARYGVDALRPVSAAMSNLPHWLPGPDMDEVDVICAQLVAECLPRMRSFGAMVAQQVPDSMGSGMAEAADDSLTKSLGRATEALRVIARRVRDQHPELLVDRPKDPAAYLRENRARLQRAARIPASPPASTQERMDPAVEATLQRPMELGQLRQLYSAAGVEPHLMVALESFFRDYELEAKAIAQEAARLPRLTVEVPAADGGPPMSMVVSEDWPALPADARATRREERAMLRRRIRDLDARRLTDLETALVSTGGRGMVAWLREWRDSECARAGFGRPMADPVSALFAAEPSMDDWRALESDLCATCTRLTAMTTAVAKADAAAQALDMEANQPARGDSDSAQMDRMMARADASRMVGNAEHALRAEGLAAVARWTNLVSAEAALRLRETWADQRFGRFLEDPTDLGSRLGGLAGLEMSAATRTTVESLIAKWTKQRQEYRSRIVEAAERLSGTASASGTIQAIMVERDEMNRRLFREVLALVPPDVAARVPALPSQH